MYVIVSTGLVDKKRKKKENNVGGRKKAGGINKDTDTSMTQMITQCELFFFCESVIKTFIGGKQILIYESKIYKMFF